MASEKWPALIFEGWSQGQTDNLCLLEVQNKAGMDRLCVFCFFNNEGYVQGTLKKTISTTHSLM